MNVSSPPPPKTAGLSQQERWQGRRTLPELLSILHGLLGVVRRVFHMALGLVGLALGLEAFVPGCLAGGLFDRALHFVTRACHLSSSRWVDQPATARCRGCSARAD